MYRERDRGERNKDRHHIRTSSMSTAKYPEILDYRNTNGHGWMFYRCDGVLRRLAPDKTLEDDVKWICHAQNFKLRDDDVMIVAYEKCGTHWLWEIVTMVLSGHPEYSKHRKEEGMLGMPNYENADKLPNPRVLSSHHYFRHLPRSLVEKRTKTIHIMRNPKDVSVSFYHHLHGRRAPNGFDGSCSELVELFLEGKASYGSYFDYIKDWQHVEKDHPDLPLLNLFYEDLKMEPVKTINIIAEFLKKPVSGELCRKIIDACNFTKLKTADKEFKTPQKDDCYWKEGHKGIYRKGEIGDWKNWLTVAQNEKFDDVTATELKGTGITFTYE